VSKLNEIQLNERFLPAVLREEKRTTIRMGMRAYAIGPNVFVCGAFEVPIIITKLEYTRVECLTEEDAIRDGFASLQELLDCLQGFYPDLHPHDCVTIVHFILKEE